MTRTDPQNFTTLLDSIAQRRSGGDGAVSARSSTHIPAPEVRAAGIPQEVKDALQPAETGMLDQFRDTVSNTDSGVQRVRAGAMSAQQFEELIDQLANSAINQFQQRQDSTKEKLKDLGHQHPDWMQTILSVFNTVTDLLIDVLGREVDFLQSLPSNFGQQASRVFQTFGDLENRLIDRWRQILG
ncbi:hypothetical protein [Nocardia sputi]|uniref:hypothetical protein n=1 Tax=Nocardia sputi TaxID=2943705 RepID=UPI0020BF969D|nr:hypothetical protein [Nocardia sputi]